MRLFTRKALIFVLLNHVLMTYSVLSDLFAPLKRIYRLRGFPFREDPDFGNKPIFDEYDFIVVGSGPAGSVVASRLTENPKWNVLLLEAGIDEGIINQVSTIAHYLQFTNYNWNYKTEYQSGACLGVVNERCLWPAGKGTGGSSLINNNIYTRGNKQDFDTWAKAGNKGWSYDELLPYFLKSEDINIAELKRSAYHGVGGPLSIEYPPFRSPLLDKFLESAREVGLNVVDYNNPNTHEGFSHIQGTVRQGRKISAYRAFIRPHKDRKNLHVAIKSRVTKILINPESKTAYGVEFVKARRRRYVRARKEVIISAGAFNSPQLLMLSGIGPKEHLEEIGIPVIQDLRVGDNLQEHPAFASLAFTVNHTQVSIIPERLLNNFLPTMLDWIEGSGWLSTLACEGLGYVHTKYNDRSKNPPPDIEYIFVPTSLAGESGLGGDLLRKSMGIPDETYNDVFRDIKNKDAWSIWPMLMYPKSRGTVRLRSANPWHAPKLQSNFFAESIDLLRIVEGIKMVIKLSQTNAFQSFGSTLNRRPLPSCKHFEFGSDDYWACCVRQWTMQMHHQCGTCKMGPEWDKNAVVSPRLKVYGIKNLRVIDASIMPIIPGAHTVAGAYMVGEKGADLIKEDWNWTTSMQS
ncbi:hypothetical protein PGB90_001832 [Kerria lacca]